MNVSLADELRIAPQLENDFVGLVGVEAFYVMEEIDKVRVYYGSLYI